MDWEIESETPVTDWEIEEETPIQTTPLSRAGADIRGAGSVLGKGALELARAEVGGLGGLGAIMAKHPVLKWLGVEAPDVSNVMERLQGAIPDFEQGAKGKQFMDVAAAPMAGPAHLAEAAIQNLERQGVQLSPALKAGYTTLVQAPAAIATGKRGPATVERVAKPSGEALKGGLFRELKDVLKADEPAAERIATRYQRKLVGSEADRATVARALMEGNQEIVPGSVPKASQIISQLPEASPLLAHEKVIASAPGGPSGKFGRRELEQRGARRALYEERNRQGDIAREKALKQVNPQGVKADSIYQRLNELQQGHPERADPFVKKSLQDMRDLIAENTDINGRIQARDLYSLRKSIGNKIQTNMKESSTFNKKLTGGLQSDLQRVMDDAIVSHGGKGWKQYLKDFANTSELIEQDIERAKSTQTPPQRTNLSSAADIVERTRVHLPNLLSRPAMLLNAVMRMRGSKLEPKVQEILARRYLNAPELAQALSPEAARTAQPPLNMRGPRLTEPELTGVPAAVPGQGPVPAPPAVVSSEPVLVGSGRGRSARGRGRMGLPPPQMRLKGPGPTRLLEPPRRAGFDVSRTGEARPVTQTESQSREPVRQELKAMGAGEAVRTRNRMEGRREEEFFKPAKKAEDLRAPEEVADAKAKAAAGPELTEKSTLEERLAHPRMKEALRQMKWTAGYSDVKGGRLLQVGTEKETGKPTSAAPWLQEPWWKDRPHKVSAKELRATVEKGIKGERLTKNQQETLKYMTDVIMGHGFDQYGRPTQ